MVELQFSDVTRVQQREKAGAVLTALPEGFYASLNDLIERVRTEYETLAAVDSSTLKAMQTYGLIQKLRECQRDIINIRSRKMLLMAHQLQSGGNPDPTPLDAVEQVAFVGVKLKLQEMHDAIGAAKLPEKPATTGGEK